MKFVTFFFFFTFCLSSPFFDISLPFPANFFIIILAITVHVDAWEDQLAPVEDRSATISERVSRWGRTNRVA